MKTEQHAQVSYGLLLTGIAFAFAAAGVTTYFTSKFTPLYAGFGASLPLATTLVIKGYGLVWLLPVSVLFLALVSSESVRGRRCFAAGLFGGIAICALVLVSLYLPLSMMGSVVQ